MSAPPSVNQVDLSRPRATMPSSSGVKCKYKQKNTSHEHGSKTGRDEGRGGVGTRHRDELHGDCEDCEDSDDRTMTNVDEPEMAIEVTEVLMGQKQPTIPIISGITTPVTQPTSGSPAYTVAF
ncbi:hypothetical protein KUCAC02_009553 [Chaenocephalus aceratus]|nr:hypothetical protein KUCAC02_009553 [Chaenocephalus aceratus]